MSRVVPFLTFQPSRGQRAAEAMEAYLALFADGQVLHDQRYGPEGPGEEGTVVLAEFMIAGQRFRCSDSFIEHEWSFTPAVSVMIDCESVQEQQRVFEALSKDGRIYMPLDDYGFGPFGWVEDRFGVSWQIAAPG